MNLDTPLAELDGISPQRLRQLHKFGMHYAGDLLTHYPRRYEDRRKFDRFPAGESDIPVCVCGNVVKTTIKRLPGWKKLFEARLEEENPNALSPEITCRWFNLHYVQKMIATGQRLVVYGKPKLRGKQICIDHPEFEIVENDEEISIHLKRITPIYRATEGLSQRVLRSLIHDLLQRVPDSELPDRLPEQLDPCSFSAALREIHFPSEWDELAKAKRHLVLTEFFALQLFIAAKREEVVSHRGEPHCGPGHLVEALHKALPFPLTGAQLRAIKEIRADLASSHPMNRLLHGDVGSGKTLVALSAMLLCAESGYQAALMAPTQILAEQHYLNFKRLLEPLGVRLALRTGARSEETAPLPCSRRRTVRVWVERAARPLFPAARRKPPAPTPPPRAHPNPARNTGVAISRTSSALGPNMPSRLTPSIAAFSRQKPVASCSIASFTGKTAATHSMRRA